jgi:hypothetical protein
MAAKDEDGNEFAIRTTFAVAAREGRPGVWETELRLAKAMKPGGKLSHPNVQKIYEVVVLPRRVHFVMPRYMCDLFDVILKRCKDTIRGLPEATARYCESVAPVV